MKNNVKLSAWISASDLVAIDKTPTEKLVKLSTSLGGKAYERYSTQSFTKTCSALKKSGVNGFELLIPFATTKENIQMIRETLRKEHMPVNSIHHSLTYLRDIPFSEITKLCRIAQDFSARVVVLHSCVLRNKLSDKTFIHKLKNIQKKYDILFGIENMPKAPFNLLDTYTYKGNLFKDVLHHAGLGITLDTTHLAQTGGDICQFYIENKDTIVNIHLSNYRKHILNRHLLLQTHTHLPLSEGELPIKKFLTLLKKTNYNGLITMEINSSFTKLCESAKIIKKGLQ